MKCPQCGAEINPNSKFCESCGSQISYRMQREQENLNKVGCPKCHSSNVQFKRETHGEVRGKSSKQIIHVTVGFCKDCGYTWFPNIENEMPKKNNTIWWILGWLFFFPIPVMILIWRKKNTWSPIVKIIVTIVFWILIFIMGASGGKDSNSKDVSSTPLISSTANMTSYKTEAPSPLITPTVNMISYKTEEPVLLIGPAVNEVKEPIQYSADSKINQFISEYNAVSKYKMSDFSQGNVRQKMYVYANDCQIELLNPSDASGYSFIIKIYGGNNEQKTEKMNEVFPDFIHTLDSSISDERISQAISDLKNNPASRRDYSLGSDLTIDYYPLVFRDDGSWLASSRIEISSLIYGK